MNTADMEDFTAGDSSLITRDWLSKSFPILFLKEYFIILSYENALSASADEGDKHEVHHRKNVWHDFSKAAVYEHPVWNHPII
jgi:hypothetical protein